MFVYVAWTSMLSHDNDERRRRHIDKVGIALKCGYISFVFFLCKDIKLIPVILISK